MIGTFTVDKETGVVTFTPTDKSYSGDVVPVKVQAADTNGTTVETTYTPKITPVVPTSEDATSTDIKVKHNLVNQPSPKEIQMFQSMKILQLPSKMAQPLRQ